MRKITIAAVGLTVASLGVLASSTLVTPQKDATPIFLKEIPRGYRDWRFISLAREDADLKDIRAQLGNDIAIRAYRDGKLPFPDGVVIGAMNWDDSPWEQKTEI